MRSFIAGTSVLLLASALFGQYSAKRLEFEAASVKPSPQPAGGFIRLKPPGGPGTADPTRLEYTFTTLRNLLMVAYSVKNYQVSGPAWLDSERYDVLATCAPGTTKEQVAVMLQNLLADRFQVKVHKETKDLPLYELTVAKGGPKLKPYVDDPNEPKFDPGQPPPLPPPGKDGALPKPPPGMNLMMIMNGKLHMVSRKTTMARLADQLSNNLRNPVVDKTGLTGDYDVDIEFSTEGLAGVPGLPGGGPPGGPGGPGIGPGPGGDTNDAPALITAVQEQLGLKLDQKKGPLDLVVVDHAEKTPAEN